MIDESLLESLEELRGRERAPRLWTEAETVLAFALAVYLPVSTLGGTKVRADGTERQHPAVRELGLLTHRSDGGVGLKVMNLRHVLTGGHRGFAHGSAMDRRVVERYAHHLDDLTEALAVAVAAWPGLAGLLAVLEGDGAGMVPEERTISEPGAADGAVADGSRDTTAPTTVLARRGQGLFRARVLGGYMRAAA